MLILRWMRLSMVLAIGIFASQACTPGMHRAFQATLSATASSLFVIDGAQTTAALRREGAVVEANPMTVAMFGERPSSTAVWTIAGGQAALAPLFSQIPGTRGSDDMGEYLKEFLLTSVVLLEGFTVWHNSEIRGVPLVSSWR